MWYGSAARKSTRGLYFGPCLDLQLLGSEHQFRTFSAKFPGGEHIPIAFSPTCCASKIFATVEDYGDIFSTLQRSIPTKDFCEASTNDLVCCMTSFHSLTRENLSQQNSAANPRHTSHGNTLHACKYSGERGCSVTN